MVECLGHFLLSLRRINVYSVFPFIFIFTIYILAVYFKSRCLHTENLTMQSNWKKSNALARILHFKGVYRSQLCSLLELLT